LRKTGSSLRHLDQGGDAGRYLYPTRINFLVGSRRESVWWPWSEQLRQEVGPDLSLGSGTQDDMHEVLTLASVIEKEMGQAASGRRFPQCFTTGSKTHSITERSNRHLWFAGIRRKFAQERPVGAPAPTYLSGAGLPPDRLPTQAFKRSRTLYPSDSRSLYFVSRNDERIVFCDAYRAQQSGGEYRSGPFVVDPFPDINRPREGALPQIECRE